jgi:exodeoxyribonuclease VII large subunit
MPENFFDFHKRVTERKPAQSPSSPADKPLTVSELTTTIDRAIKAGVPASVTVRGEVSNASTRQSSGHFYFTMKDATACINCAMWRDNAVRLKFKLEDGLDVIATGRVTVYAPQGRYQLTVNRLEPAGRGALELAFKQLQAKLAAEGLFDAQRKKPIPRYPSRIAIVTSRDGAALQDMLKVLRRFSWLKLLVYHVPVQGEGSAPKIAAAIQHLSSRAPDVGGIDAILLARGGGSLEDLWSFNEEIVARAVAASRIPVITGIGHEVDCSIADLVADHHAHTPTEAAQVVTRHWNTVRDSLAQYELRHRRSIVQTAQDLRRRLQSIERHEFFRRPMDRIQLLRQLLDDRQKSLKLVLSGRLRTAQQRLIALEPRLPKASKSAMQLRTTRLESLEKHLEALSPQGVLNRGYTITTLKKTGQIVKDSRTARPGDRLLTRFADGQTESIVEDSTQMSLFE